MDVAKHSAPTQPHRSDYFRIADESPALIWSAGVDKLCHWFNKSWLAFTGRSMAQEQGNGWAEGVHPDDIKMCFDRYTEAFEARERFTIEYRLRNHDGEYRWIIDFGTPDYDEAGVFKGYNGLCFDIHERKVLEEKRQSQTNFIEAILECEPECVKVVSPVGNLEMMNRAGLDMLEVANLEEAQSLGLIHFILPAHQAGFIDLHRRVMAGERGTLEFEVVGEKGTKRWLETHAAPLYDKSGKVSALIGITRDVTERRAFLKKLEYQAHTDSLTGLPNRGYFFELAERELNRVSRYGGAISLLMLDIDRFKDVNDRYGHKAGDLVLINLARTCQSALRDIDVVGRLGGEEFAILLPETDNGKAFEVAERLRVAIANSTTTLADGHAISITTSFGVTTRDGAPADLDTLIQQADQAMYSAKGAGRNKVL
ncbi:MAG: diguanylate cyclase [Gammaproteobacteria bacterium]|nr:diguanylate cyclase [Gammaproteobacteria bacterium]